MYTLGGEVLDKRKLTKVITIATIITSIVTVVSLGVRYLIPLYLAYKFSIETGRASSVGIIGGADGPTVVFYGGQHYITPITIIIIVFGLASIAEIIYLILNRKVIK